MLWNNKTLIQTKFRQLRLSRYYDLKSIFGAYSQEMVIKSNFWSFKFEYATLINNKCFDYIKKNTKFVMCKVLGWLCTLFHKWMWPGPGLGLAFFCLIVSYLLKVSKRSTVLRSLSKKLSVFLDLPVCIHLGWVA